MLFAAIEPISGLVQQVWDVDPRERIGAFDDDDVAGRGTPEGLAGEQHRQRAFEAPQIQGSFGHGAFVHPDSVRPGPAKCRTLRAGSVSDPFSAIGSGSRKPAHATWPTWRSMRVLGIAGWSGAGKTVLITRLIPRLIAWGLRVATVKHAHHEFEIDLPGKDSFEHRAAGASEVIVSSARRVAQIQELRGAPEPRLADLLRRVSPCDLVLVEGFKHEQHAKLEVFRSANGRPPLHPADASIVAIASDRDFPGSGIDVASLDDIDAIGKLVLAHARGADEVLLRLQGDGATQR